MGEHEAEVGEIWATRTTLSFDPIIESNVFNCLKGIVWSWIRYKLILSQYKEFMLIKESVFPASLVKSTTFKESYGKAVGSTWWSGKYSLFPGAEAILTLAVYIIFY